MLSLAVLLGFFAAGFTFTMRKLVPQLWLLVKPWSCDLCMSWWSSWAGVVVYSAHDFIPLLKALPLVFASTGLSVILVKLSNRLDAAGE